MSPTWSRGCHESYVRAKLLGRGQLGTPVAVALANNNSVRFIPHRCFYNVPIIL